MVPASMRLSRGYSVYICRVLAHAQRLCNWLAVLARATVRFVSGQLNCLLLALPFGILTGTS